MNDTFIRFTPAMIHDRGFIKRLEQADVVLTQPTSPEWNSQIAFGGMALRGIEKTGKAGNLQVL